jgi:hypothetical protein
MDTTKLFSRVIDAQEKHNAFLDATQKNLSYFLFGKNIDLVRKATPTTLPIVDILNVINSFNPSPDNPLHQIVSAFTDEISVSDFRTSVKPYPVDGKEPYDSYADQLESYLGRVHRISKRRSYMKALAFELLVHGYFGIYFDGGRYYFLTAYDLIPGDKGIFDQDAQPFWVRKTQANRSVLRRCGVDPANETAIFGTMDELEMFQVYDVYVKSTNLNVGYTQSGKVLYTQQLREPQDKYPLFVANTSELINSFYPVPAMSALVEKLKDYQNARISIKESASSIAKPILVYDDDAGIDVNKLLTALKQGYKHVIVGKNREGDINFKAPGQLPAYAQVLPEQIEEDIMKDLGLNKAFLGFASQGARERGALARLIKTSFRRLASLSGIIEDVFTDLDKYIIDYVDSHRLSLRDKAGFNIEEIFDGDIIYEPTERFTAYSSEDSYENRMFTLNQWKSQLLPTVDALEQLGDVSPRKTINRIKKEAIQKQLDMVDAQKKVTTEVSKSVMDKVTSRLNGQLKFRYYLSPLSGNKILVSANVSDIKLVSFLLSDIISDILVEPTMDFEPKTPEQDTFVVPEPVTPPPAPVDQFGQPVPTVPGEPTQPNQPIQEETRGRPANPQNMEAPTPTQDMTAQVNASVEAVPTPAEVAPAVENSVPAAVPTNTSEVFDPNEINGYMKNSKVLYDLEKYVDLPGMYMVEPHAKWVYLGRKLALVMATNNPEAIDKPMIFCGKQAYGVIVLKKIISDFDFAETQKYHLVNDRERMRWWGDKPVYLYLFEFYPLKYPMNYKRSPGIQTFFPKVELINESSYDQSTEQEPGSADVAPIPTEGEAQA